METKSKLIRCMGVGCTRQLTSTQMIRLVWKKQNKYADVCDKCCLSIQDKQIKEMQIPLETMVKTGYYDKGAREIDFKSYLQKWTKRMIERTT